MPKIIQLEPHLANLIAAGEVVERPASVVKELVENSIDAGAKTITVELQNGGMTFLRVSDDGCGMSREDAKTAFLRHATSKLRTREDLEAIGTLGFRGEALAATAAVSRIDLLTRTADTLAGSHLTLEGGKLLSCEEAGCPVGTTIVVRDLFFNTPARMKFMKRDSVEGSAAASAVQKQALAHPEISFRLIKDGQSQLHTPGDGALLSAVYAVLGRQAALEMVPVESQWQSLRLTGFVSRPTATRGTRANQFFYVNQRLIYSKTLTAALEEAYRNQLMVGRFPSCVLNLSMPLSSVDVNVHPAKTEVKFLNEREIFDCVHYGVLGTLNRTPGQVPFVMKERPAGAQSVSTRASGSADAQCASLHADSEGRSGSADAQCASLHADSEGRSGSVGAQCASLHAGSEGRSGSADAQCASLHAASEGRSGSADAQCASLRSESGRASVPARPQAPVHTVSRQEYEQIAAVLHAAPRPEPSQALRDAVRAAPLRSDVQRPMDGADGFLAPLGMTESGRPGASADAQCASLHADSEGRSASADAQCASVHADSEGRSASADAQCASLHANSEGRSESADAPCPSLPSESEAGRAADSVPLPLAGVEAGPTFRYIGEAFRTYVLVEQGENLILIDKHAAHERMNFERLLAQGTTVVGQTLLQPLTSRFDREEAALLLEHRELLLSLGYDVDDLGEGDLLLRQIPSDVSASDAAATLSEIAGHLRDGRLDTPTRLRDEALHTIACKAAIKAGYITDPAELQRLAAEVLRRDDLKYCPHGRPVCTVISKREMEKQFRRVK